MTNECGTNREFTWGEGLAFCLAYVGVQLCSEVINQWGTYFYSPSEGVGRTIFVHIGMVKYIFIIGTMWDALIGPVVGVFSDKTSTQPGRLRRLFAPIRGRRRPFIFFGSIFMVFTSIAFWYPPVQGNSPLNLYYGTFMLCMHWTLFTITTMPLFALGPEVARSEEARVKLGTWIAVGLVVGLAVANGLSGLFIEWLSTAPEGQPTSPEAYRRLSAIYAVISLILFQLPVWLVRERYDSETAAQKNEPIFEGFTDAARNIPFIIYFTGFFMFTVGFLAAQRALPYWAELGLEGGEATVTILLLPFIVTALASYAVIPSLARRLRCKWMIIIAFIIIATGLPWMYVLGVLDISSQVKTIFGAILFAYCGIGQGIMYVMATPMMGEIIDYDEQYSGQRREAMYNGLVGVAMKASMAGSVFIASKSMDLWGNSPERPFGVFYVGPIAGIFALIGLAAMLFYPVLNVARKVTE